MSEVSHQNPHPDTERHRTGTKLTDRYNSRAIAKLSEKAAAPGTFHSAAD